MFLARKYIEETGGATGDIEEIVAQFAERCYTVAALIAVG